MAIARPRPFELPVTNATRPSKRNGLFPCGCDIVSPSNDLVNRLDVFDPDQLLIQSSIEVRKLVGIDTQLMEDGGVQTPDVERLLDRRRAQFVGRADALAP